MTDAEKIESLEKRLDKIETALNSINQRIIDSHSNLSKLVTSSTQTTENNFKILHEKLLEDIGKLLD